MDFQGKQILITGADGFIGSHLCEKLVSEGASIRAMVYYNAFGHWGWLDDLHPETLQRIEVFMGDVRDPHSTAQAAEGCEIIFHLAALIGIPYSYHAPDSYVDTNIKGTLNVLQAARRHNVQKLVITSTSEVYGTAQYVPIDENHPRQGQSPYSASKIAADAMAMAFHRSFELPVVIARPFNTYGPRQSARAIIPTIITQLLEGKDVIELGSLYPTRDLVFVKDTIDALLKIVLEDNCIGKEINIATGSEISMAELAEMLRKQINPDAVIKQVSARKRPDQSEVDRLLGNPHLLESLTSWKSSTNLENGLAETIAWFREKRDGKRYKTDVYTI